MKEHKKQIIAALALAFSLGMVIPGFTYASEGAADEGISTLAEGGEEAQAEGSEGGGSNKEDVISQDVSSNIVELVSRIKERDSFADYRKAEPYVYYTKTVTDYTTNAETYLKKQVSEVTGDDRSYWDNLSAETQTAVKEKNVFDALTYIKNANGNDYNRLKTRTDRILEVANSDMASLKTKMAALLPSVSTDGITDPASLVKEAIKLPNFQKYLNLFDALTFVRSTVTAHDLTCATSTPAPHADGEGEDDEKGYLIYCPAIAEDLDKALDKDYKEEDLFKDYNKLAITALAIDETVMEGLMKWDLPETGKPAGDDKPNAPDAGIVGLIESGALDLGTITLIVSVALASAAGLGLIAKLYLKHKF